MHDANVLFLNIFPVPFRVIWRSKIRVFPYARFPPSLQPPNVPKRSGLSVALDDVNRHVGSPKTYLHFTYNCFILLLGIPHFAERFGMKYIHDSLQQAMFIEEDKFRITLSWV